MAILTTTNCFTLSTEEAQRLSAAAQKEADKRNGPQWLKKVCWYGAYPIGIVAVGLWFQNLGAGIASFLFFWGVSASSNALYRQIYKKNKESEERPTAGTEWRVILEDEALITRSRELEERYAWNFFTAVDVTTNYVYVRRAFSFQIVIPKIAFTSEAEASAFLGLLNQKVPKPL